MFSNNGAQYLSEHALFQHGLRMFETISNIISEQFERSLFLETITSDLNLAFDHFKVNVSGSRQDVSVPHSVFFHVSCATCFSPRAT